MIVSLIVSIALAAAMADEGAAAAVPAEAATPAEAVTPAPAAETAAPAAPAAPVVDRDQEVVCKKEAKTASRTPSKKICQTRAQWRAEETRGGVQTRER